MFRRLADKRDQPMNALVLAQFLGSADRRKFTEAIEICDRIWAEVPVVAVAEVAVSILNELPPNSREFNQVERRLDEAMKKAPDNAELMVAMANLRNFQGQYEKAEELYRAALVKNPRQGTALNNLAWIIALRSGKSAEAIELINRAMEVVGNEAGLIDTRGVAHLARKQPSSYELAIKDFETVASENPDSASAYFHLAQAYAAAGKRKEANEAWQKAKKNKLSIQVLHPLERPAYEQLSRELN
jgi:tetratricopeptide (TPR) repeat protein